METVGLDPQLASRSSPSGNRWLRAALRALPISANDRIIDIGCGKGSAMRVMLAFPFSRIEGIELSPLIADTARHNFRRLRVPDERLRVHVADARDFDGLDEFNYIYLYNPFPSEIFKPFLQRVTASLDRRPRGLTIVYNNPICDEQIMSTGGFQKVLQLPAEWNNTILVYKSLSYQS
ncbi:MAG: class I SAM-dependent methyltransferase [Steroidobacteraceae bacterium]